MGVGGCHAPVVLPVGKGRGTHCKGRGGGGHQGRSGRVRKILPPPGLEPPTVQHVASRYTDWATPAHVGQDR